MPGPPIRKPSDHSPPAGSPRNIAGHHVLHRPLMPRHPPNAQKNKQQRHTNKTRNTLSQKSYSKMLASTIQFTTNPPTPTTPPHNSEAEPQARQPGRTTPEPRQHATPTRTQARTGTPTTTQTRQQQACFLYQQQTTNHTREQQTHETQSTALFRKNSPPAGPDPSTAQTTTTRKPPPHNTYP